MGKRSSWQTVSQNSTGYDAPYVLRVEKRESKALSRESNQGSNRKKGYSQSSDFQIFAIHDDIVKTEKYREPKSDHAVIHGLLCTGRFGIQCAFWALQHDGYNTAEHSNG